MWRLSILMMEMGNIPTAGRLNTEMMSKDSEHRTRWGFRPGRVEIASSFEASEMANMAGWDCIRKTAFAKMLGNGGGGKLEERRLSGCRRDLGVASLTR